MSRKAKKSILFPAQAGVILGMVRVRHGEVAGHRVKQVQHPERRKLH